MLPDTMRAARLHTYGQPFQIDEVPVPRPEVGQVLIRVEGAGFCHSDLHVASGELPVLPQLPHTLGHENAGTVAAVGAGVQTVKEGDAVVVYGGWGDGVCDYCVSGEENLCPTFQWVGLSQHQGGYAEYLLVPQERYLIPLQRLSPREAAPLTDAALTPYRAIKRALPSVTADYPTLVIGAGGLGQFGIKLLRLLSGSEVIALDISDEKLATAREVGAHHTLNSREEGVLDRIMELSRGGVAAAFDMVGSEATLALAAASTRRLGSVVQVGLAGGAARLKALENWQAEVKFWVSFWGNIKELREVIAMSETGQLTSIPLEFAGLEEINDVYHRLEEGKVQGRAVITP
jgi:alcohol dehydrogenase, propanol-preferring